uniref:Uncharacterized protein n=1 Tax=Tetranychus urticae TaxID=32264 RepID=T1KAF9_TETUR
MLLCFLVKYVYHNEVKTKDPPMIKIFAENFIG